MATRWELVQQALLAAQDTMHRVSKEAATPGATAHEKIEAVERTTPLTRLLPWAPGSKALWQALTTQVNRELGSRFPFVPPVTKPDREPLYWEVVAVADAQHVLDTVGLRLRASKGAPHAG